MRLFIAINFDDAVKDVLCKAIEGLKGCAQKGNFTHRENLHLTLVFIGEAENTRAIQASMDRIEVPPFALELGELGKFKRMGGDIYWVGVEKSEPLARLYHQLHKGLTHSGFQLEQREYKPHLTIGREVVCDQPPQINVPHINTIVSKISLMKSERVGGKLTYTEVYTKELCF